MNEILDQRFLSARRDYIRRQFAQLNGMQQQAVLTTEGPLLLLAGAGSGKTTVLINRIANIMRFGRGSDSAEIPDTVTEEDVLFLENLEEEPSDYDRWRADSLCAVERAVPWSIMAITFTNKAANELKERLTTLLGPEAQDIWAMTFHSACCRILRRDIERMGYTRSFTIYDSSDSERVMKEIVKDMGLDDKTFPPKYVLGAISREKDNMVSGDEMLERAERTGDLRALHIAKAYVKYQTSLKENNALDFDDIIYVTVRLLQEHEDVRTYYQRKFRYVLVDEYQDTNHMQYLLTSLLAGGYENICVVGDDDQSIYRFRGATIENILNFEKQYRGSRIIRLEQNYRSTQSILNAANAVIAHNLGRKGKRLWTSNGQGDPITVYEASDEGTEANYVAGQIIKLSKGKEFKDYAVLYRTNAQSNAMEFAFKRNGIPYRVIGGTRFFDRAEVKDMLSYLCVINNRADDLRLKRIINNPPRGLGPKTIEMAQRLAEAEGIPLYSVVSDPYSYGPLEKPAQKLMQFTALIEGMAQLLEDGISLPDFYEELLIRSGYVDALNAKPTEENKTRLENVRELKSSINSYVENAASAGEIPSLAGFLEEIALYTDLEQYNEGDDAVVMMTMHSAKGLEFPHVFLVGFEDGLFPGMRAIGDKEEMEEERRLCYVAITRAKKTLTICHARQRMLYGRTSAAMASRFLKEIPEECIVRKGGMRVRQEPSYGSYSGFGSFAENSGYTVPVRKPQPKRVDSPMVAAPKTGTYLELNKGDMVLHAAFGRGMVLSVMKMGGDALLEIAFDDIGTKKLMAKTASAHMKKL
ncbi:MAG: UvrD-helicase domain-containing protein [Oscillospiraceae bacterium]|nr:UvrD-helicase domain-containing protein [Oscillospiraceae bacterium]